MKAIFRSSSTALSLLSVRFVELRVIGKQLSISACRRMYSTGRERRLHLHDYPADVQKLATFANEARAGNYQVSHLLSQVDPSLNQAKAYQVAAAICALRRDAGEQPVGRKIGFTNRNIWPEYNIDASNWSYMYDRTVTDLTVTAEKEQPPVQIDVSNISNLEPKLEPEIILGLKKKPHSGMTDLQLLDCVGWISHGFEIVQSIFPGWRFTAADTTAAFALHGHLLVGSKIPTAELGSAESVLHSLQSFTIDLFRDGELVDRGAGANVLGSPVNALRHLCELVEQDEWNLPVAKDEIVTTGTLTRAWKIKDQATWETQVTGLAVSGLHCKFVA